MPSPFPGMDPYLEHPNIWEDFHANLAGEIQAQLTPQLRPRYVAALTPKITYDEVLLGVGERRLVKPDVSVFETDPAAPTGTAVAIAPPPLIGEAVVEVPIKLYTIELREVDSGRLVTAIEILSPVNKRPSHQSFEAYRHKRRNLMRAGVHLLEIDLLRGGERIPLVTELPNVPYFVFLTRGEATTRVDIWPLTLDQPFPILPVPLLAPDPDVPLDLGQAIHNIYDRAAYDLRVDYSQPPPSPELSAAEKAYIEKTLKTE